jgi:hypothetical protein
LKQLQKQTADPTFAANNEEIYLVYDTAFIEN